MNTGAVAQNQGSLFWNLEKENQTGVLGVEVGC